MNKTGLLICLLLFLLATGKISAQFLNCNGLVYFSLDETCTHTIIPEEVLDGGSVSDCVVELDKTPPYGNGPWGAPVLGAADIGKTYGMRVRHLPSGNICTGNVKAEDKLPPKLSCNEISVVDLNGTGAATVPSSNLSVTAVENCGGLTLTPASFQFDCTDLGMNTVQLTATDNSGNTSTCLHTVLVSNADNCVSCISDCPQSVVVTYDEGNTNLVPAFQAGNATPFDTYGNALYDPVCTYLDSTYLLDYQVGTTGYNWFARRWLWISPLGQFNLCEQIITFPSTHTVSVQGKIYLDTDDDCSADAGEQGVHQFLLKLTKLPSGQTQTIYPNPDGTYNAQVIFSPQDLSADLELLLPPGVNPVCPTALSIPNTTAIPSHIFDIGIQSNGDCPQMQVDLGNLFLRRCASNFFKVQYCNTGLDTAYGAFVTLNLDSLISLQSADVSYTVSGPDSIYTFQVGNVPPFHCGTFYVNAFINCDAILGQTLCNEANVYPDAPCGGPSSGAEIVATATCSGDSVSLILQNRGDTDMMAPLDYIVIEDFIMYRGDSFQLDAGESVTIKTPSNGATWRIESDQVPGAPTPGLVSAAIEGCGGINTPGLINAFGQADDAIHYDQYCGQVVGSCDPNDKNAVPIGLFDEHFVRNSESIEYKIRFQNTGTDTAFKVVIVDTLSTFLDVLSLETGASSHPYNLKIYPGGILHFVFLPIALPDSNVNEIASHGYVQFRISQKPGLADGTRIENKAAIYFDQNEAVVTNTAFHTIGYPIVIPDPITYTAQTVSPSCSGAQNGSILVAVSGGLTPYTYQWNDNGFQSDSLSGLAAGTYSLTITDSHGVTADAIFTLTAPAPISITLDATATFGNDNIGAINAAVTGGTAGYSYLWSNGASTQNLTGLSAGLYTLIVTDANGCTQQQEATVELVTFPLFYTAQLQSPACNGAADGAINVAVSGGLMPYNFQWSNNGAQIHTLTGLSAGTYTVTISDSVGNTLEATFELTEPAPIDLNLSATATLGNDNIGTVVAATTGGIAPYVYTWSNGATTPNLFGLAAGVYSLIVTDANGCTQTGEATVEQTVLPLNFAAMFQQPSCNGAADGHISLDIMGGLAPYTYQWSLSSLSGPEVSGLAAGAYTVTVTDSHNGVLIQTFTLVEPAAIVVAVSATPATGNQSNGTASAAATGGTGTFAFLWSNGATGAAVFGLPAGIYTVTATDSNGCTSATSVTVESSVGTIMPGLLSGIQVWPNPAHDHVILNLGSALPHLLRMDVINADGRYLYQFKANELQTQFNLSLENTHAGGIIMLVFYGYDGSMYTEKVVIR